MCLPTNRVWEVTGAFVCFDNMLGKFVAGGSVVVVVLPSSSSFLLMAES